MSDGGEGLLDALGGTRRVTTVTGPLGAPVDAEWRVLDLEGGAPRTAVIEMSKAAGRALVPHPRGDDPVRARTVGVGQLLLAARDAGARRIVVGCGGSATTDGGEGAFDAVGSPAALGGVELVVASDVTTPLHRRRRRVRPAEGRHGRAGGGAGPPARRGGGAATGARAGVDVTTVPGAGAAGGLAGGLVALGARIEPGFALVAGLVGLAGRLETRRPRGHGRGPRRPALVPRQGPRRCARAGAGTGAAAVGRCRCCAWPAAWTPPCWPIRRRAWRWSA